MNRARERIRSLLRVRFGIEVRRVDAEGAGPADDSAVERYYDRYLWYEADPDFNELYQAGLDATNTPDVDGGYSKRRERFYNTLELFRQVLPRSDGLIAECGCWKGLSSYLFCHAIRGVEPGFAGAGFHIFDSFEGLSEPREVDRIRDTKMGEFNLAFGNPVGSYAATQAEVQQAFSDFPELQLHRGWLPSALADAPDGPYRFVHLDLDLYEPLQGCLSFFVPRLAPDGLLVCDDYGSLFWPGAKRAIDEYCDAHDLRPLLLSTGQAVIFGADAARAIVEKRVRTG